MPRLMKALVLESSSMRRTFMTYVPKPPGTHAFRQTSSSINPALTIKALCPELYSFSILAGGSRKRDQVQSVLPCQHLIAQRLRAGPSVGDPYTPGKCLASFGQPSSRSRMVRVAKTRGENHDTQCKIGGDPILRHRSRRSRSGYDLPGLCQPRERRSAGLSRRGDRESGDVCQI